MPGKGQLETFADEFKTAADVNDVLSRIGLGPLGISAIGSVLQSESRDMVTRALGVVKHNQPTSERAKAFLQRVFAPYTLQRMDQHQASGPAPETPRRPATPSSKEAASDRRAQQRAFIGHHVYGREVAVYFEATRTKDVPDGAGGVIEGRPTIHIEAAGLKQRGEARRGPAPKGSSLFDWENKLIIQLSESELPIVAAVLLGKLPACEFKHHGPAKDKGFSIQRQADEKRLFLRVFATGVNHAIQITSSDIFAVASLFLRQLQAAKPWLDAAMLSLALDSLVFEQDNRVPVPGEAAPVRQPKGGTADSQSSAPSQRSHTSAPRGEGAAAGQCDECGAALSARVKDYSINNYGRPLCMTHQKTQQH